MDWTLRRAGTQRVPPAPTLRNAHFSRLRSAAFAAALLVAACSTIRSNLTQVQSLTSGFTSFVGPHMPSVRTSAGKVHFDGILLDRAGARLSAGQAGARPSPPNSTEEMCRQAADAVMMAYRDGYTRQTIRLRLDAAFEKDPLSMEQGILFFMQKTLPLARSFATKLWDGSFLKDLKTAVIDDDGATVLYREATSKLQDAAILYLAGRELVTSPKLSGFIKGMGPRLVVLANPESASDGFKVESQGKDFVDWFKGSEKGAEVCEEFKLQSYYYHTAPINNWRMAFFRAYPHPWEIFVENLDYQLVKVGESPTKPSFDELLAMLDSYEKEHDVKLVQKIAKMLKDAGSDPDVDKLGDTSGRVPDKNVAKRRGPSQPPPQNSRKGDWRWTEQQKKQRRPKEAVRRSGGEPAFGAA